MAFQGLLGLFLGLPTWWAFVLRFCMLGGSLCFSLMALVAAELGSGRVTKRLSAS